ncbi:hypothetical protein I551_0447 [Mycobacterium ulcerans str. Harvey]|uniref:Uncharacterized protein n=1 Tax=Mycobacterium ulcerans str. Harvey TaxID=1299332 RepID=A0ABN0R792_MYCUL|nr:hypothetical protein I551_0447 [Mycobacterium ulcerans str. Harvey]
MKTPCGRRMSRQPCAILAARSKPDFSTKKALIDCFRPSLAP